MSRRQSDPRVRKLLAIFDRHVASPEYSRNTNSLLQYLITDIVFQQPIESWCCHFGTWAPDQLRGVLLGFALNAPDTALDTMVVAANDALVVLEDFERDCAEDRQERAA